ncbi:hypothetical protein [Verrucomicrobium sp. GAS474]|uniref:hypothetical protein n=1 Tax=Verrucomicrobium sp. GAS474 TaxID=1882831 RepID=UPI000B830E94|nr:hypothetical protein [Verrucomicrobium sp. GAS474]
MNVPHLLPRPFFAVLSVALLLLAVGQGSVAAQEMTPPAAAPADVPATPAPAAAPVAEVPPVPAPPRPNTPPKEYIIVSGGPALRFFEKGKEGSHDKFWGNFIVSASLRILEIQQERGANDLVSWLVYRPTYERRGMESGQDFVAAVQKKADSVGASLYWFSDPGELINYVNKGRDRKTVPVGDFEYFGHSNRACFMFDYSNEYDAMSRSFLHERMLSQIDPTVFSPKATAKSWGCHTGEEFSDEWKKKLGFAMIGAIGKTDYSNGKIPVLSNADGKWSE